MDNIIKIADVSWLHSIPVRYLAQLKQWQTWQVPCEEAKRFSSGHVKFHLGMVRIYDSLSLSFLVSFFLSFLPSIFPSFPPSFLPSFFLSLYPKNKPGTWKWWFPNKISEYLGFIHCLLHLSFGECTPATISYNWFLNIHESTPISVAKDNEHSLSSPKKDVVKSAAAKEQLKWAKAFRITAASTSESLSASSINSSKSTFHWATKW